MTEPTNRAEETTDTGPASDHPQVVVGYLREHLMMSPTELERARSSITSYAQSKSLELDTIYVESRETVPEAFRKMIEKIEPAKTKAIIVPGVHHLAGLGCPPLAVYKALKEGGVSVILAPHVQ